MYQFALVIVFFLFCLHIFTDASERKARAKDKAAEIGCEYIGTPRGVDNVKIIECEKELKMIKVD